ncbi:FGGY-family carbohydrate kinase [Flavihumibacter stibioxidans]|uniref:Carbohydrate kinase n=1 Tax=Flavihumibacter stibioxidans TaxID=1834163 RepID=A0ABR7MAH7_9BACT|nr:FGGY family carbohydrate kinase [Flavihumibacter stibioxidans]MBC6491834.1 carbohydrate kinase [Flavihumibacter stibioxidans]
MTAIPVIAVFDIGKTNKKLLLFDAHYQVVKEMAIRIEEITDEDGFPCDDLQSITHWIFLCLDELLADPAFELKAVNFSAYGASFVNVNEQGKPITPLYNYLKPYPQELFDKFYQQYGGEETWSLETASPVLGNLNSGLQLYRIKMEKPELFRRVQFALHLPQYFSFLLTGKPYSDITSIGCHTGLWNYAKMDYHHWVKTEGIDQKLAPVKDSTHTELVSYKGHKFLCGIGMHDSSAALVPYIKRFSEPFALLSTGTWCITLNPFNAEPLSAAELQADCLCYLGFKGQPVKASRLFAGHEHEKQVARMVDFFGVDPIALQSTAYDADIIHSLRSAVTTPLQIQQNVPLIESLRFISRNLHDYANATVAYHQLMLDLVELQCYSSQLVLRNAAVQQLFVDGGFSRNPIFMRLLQDKLEAVGVLSMNISQASALGAAIACGDFPV